MNIERAKSYIWTCLLPNILYSNNWFHN